VPEQLGGKRLLQRVEPMNGAGRGTGSDGINEDHLVLSLQASISPEGLPS